jgi:hypothetical protein
MPLPPFLGQPVRFKRFWRQNKRGGKRGKWPAASIGMAGGDHANGINGHNTAPKGGGKALLVR